MSNMATVGMVVGFAVGAVIGYFTGGLGFVLMGAALGMALGSYIDPVQADMSGAGQPQYGELEMTTASEGMILPDALGTAKLTGNIFWYGGSRNKAVKEKVEGGKGGGGGSSKQVVGYKYYLSWALGLCIGPIDELLAVYMGDELVWSGTLARPSNSAMSAITLDIMGTMYINWGGSNNSAVGSVDTPLNDFAWMYFSDCFIGGRNAAPIMKFIFRKAPEFAFSSSGNIGLYDYNPAHAIYYVMNHLCGLPSTWIDSTSFGAAATNLAKMTELRGISLVFNKQQTALEYIAGMLSHVDGLVRFATTGKFEMKLLRADEDKDDLPEITKDDLVKPASIRRSHWIEVTNDIKVQYAERVNVDAGYPDIYGFSFIDEACSEYTVSWTDYNPGPYWLTDLNAFQAGGFSWLRTGSSLNGLAIKTERPETGYTKPIIPTGYSFGTHLNPYRCWNVNMPLTGYSWVNELQTPFLNNMIPSRGYIPGSWFMFNIDDTSTQEYVQDRCYASIASFVAWLTSAGYSYNYYNASGSKLQGSERWLNWIMTNVDPD